MHTIKSMDRWSKFASTANFRKIVFFGKLHKDFTEILQSGRRLIGFMKIFYENFLRGNPLIIRKSQSKPELDFHVFFLRNLQNGEREEEEGGGENAGRSNGFPTKRSGASTGRGCWQGGRVTGRRKTRTSARKRAGLT